LPQGTLPLNSQASLADRQHCHLRLRGRLWHPARCWRALLLQHRPRRRRRGPQRPSPRGCHRGPSRRCRGCRHPRAHRRRDIRRFAPRAGGRGPLRRRRRRPYRPLRRGVRPPLLFPRTTPPVVGPLQRAPVIGPKQGQKGRHRKVASKLQGCKDDVTVY
jgi:hypothetical protein